MVRKEIHLDQEAIDVLELEAHKKNKSLKNYLETIAVTEANNINKPSDEYKENMLLLYNKVESLKVKTYTLKEILEYVV